MSTQSLTQRTFDEMDEAFLNYHSLLPVRYVADPDDVLQALRWALSALRAEVAELRLKLELRTFEKRE